MGTALALAAITALAGLVYGFAGFGAALIAVPLFSVVVDPAAAIGLLAIVALGSVASVLPAALRQCNRRAVAVILTAALLFMPPGVQLLRIVDPVAIRWIMAGIVLGTLLALLAGFRLTRTAGPASWAGVGALVGLFGGATGLNGPPLILFQLAGPDGAAVSRANTIAVLTCSSLALVPVLWISGVIGADVLVRGMALVPVYAAASWAGARLFTPARESLYRRSAYTIIGLAGFAALPVFD